MRIFNLCLSYLNSMPSALSRDEIVQSIVSTFRHYGYDGTSLSVLSEATGLGRSSLYHHFPNGKTDMAEAAFEWALVQYVTLVIKPLQQTDLPAIERLRLCAKGLGSFYDDGVCSCLLNIFSVGGANVIFHEKLRGSTQTVIQMFAQIAEENGISSKTALRRGEDLFIALQGTLVLSRVVGSNDAFLRVLKEFPEQLLAPES
jgi:AcrR family transcriptional regulator